MTTTHLSVSERIAGGRLSVDLAALVRNWQWLNKQSGKAQAAAVVKADGYGLGLEPVVGALYKAGCSRFFTAFVDEGIRTRKCAPDAEIFVLGGMPPHSQGYYLENNLVPVLNTPGDLQRWSDHGRMTGNRKPCALHLETGINRLGLREDQLADWFDDDHKRHSLTPILVMSHLACGDVRENPMNKAQLARFRHISPRFSGVDLSLANSAGIALGKAFHFNVTRPGIALYGGEFSTTLPALDTVATLCGRIAQIASVKAGETVGYGGAGKVSRNSRIAVVSVGYGDGYPRAASGAGVSLRSALEEGASGWLGGYMVPVLGRVSMDMTVFDVTDVPQGLLNEHDWIELFGNNIKLDDVARKAGTIGYELLTSLGKRYERVYREG